jgi:hypothetical protein
MISSRDSYNMRKIHQFNKIDQTFDKENLKQLIIKPIKIEKPNQNILTLVNSRETESKKELDECVKKRTNQPYKGIIKNFNYNKEFKKQDDLIVHKVTDKDKIGFNDEVTKYNTTIKSQNIEIKDVYSNDKKNEHKKQFEYQHKYKYRNKLENTTDTDADLRVDRIEFYKKEQQKLEDSKKKIDDILGNLIDSGVLSENFDSINYDKINVDELEQTLINQFGKEEYKKLLKEIK